MLLWALLNYKKLTTINNCNNNDFAYGCCVWQNVAMEGNPSLVYDERSWWKIVSHTSLSYEQKGRSHWIWVLICGIQNFAQIGSFKTIEFFLVKILHIVKDFVKHHFIHLSCHPSIHPSDHSSVPSWSAYPDEVKKEWNTDAAQQRIIYISVVNFFFNF